MATQGGVKKKTQKTQDQDDVPLKAEGESNEQVYRKLASKNDDKPRLFPAVAMVSVTLLLGPFIYTSSSYI